MPLLRQYKRRVDEKGTTYEDLEYYNHITKAYDTIMGFSHDYSDDNPTSPIPYKVRKAWGKWCTVFDQYKLAFLMAAVILCLGVMFVIQTGKNGEEDIAVKFVGAYMADDEKRLVENLNARAGSFDNVQLSFFSVTTATDEFDSAAKTQATAFLSQLMAGAVDVVLIDKESFDVYVTQTAFLKLDDYIEAYYKKTGDSGKLRIFEYESEEENGVSVEHGIYGIEVSDSAFFNDLGLKWLYDEEKGQEKTMIFTICRTSKRADTAWSFGEELIKRSRSNI